MQEFELVLLVKQRSQTEGQPVDPMFRNPQSEAPLSQTEGEFEAQRCQGAGIVRTVLAEGMMIGD